MNYTNLHIHVRHPESLSPERVQYLVEQVIESGLDVWQQHANERFLDPESLKECDEALELDHYVTILNSSTSGGTYPRPEVSMAGLMRFLRRSGYDRAAIDKMWVTALQESEKEVAGGVKT